MSFFRTFGCCLLALALVANAGLGTVASAMDHSAHAVAEPLPHSMDAVADDAPTCHDSASSQMPDKPDTAPMDCCDDGACACSCLHHAPVLVLGEPLLSAPRHGWVAQLGRLDSRPSTPIAPAIRPPIA